MGPARHLADIAHPPALGEPACGGAPVAGRPPGPSAGSRLACRPITPVEWRWARALMVERLHSAPSWRRAVPPGLRRVLLAAQVQGALRAGRGWTDGRAVALVDPPGTGASWLVSCLVASMTLLFVGAVVACGWWQPQAGAGLGLVGLGALVIWLWPLRRVIALGAGHWLDGHHGALPDGGSKAAWVHAVAKPACDGPGSAEPLLCGLAEMGDRRDWMLALETDHPGLVRRYGAHGFETVASVPAPWGRRAVMVRMPRAADGRGPRL